MSVSGIKGSPAIGGAEGDQGSGFKAQRLENSDKGVTFCLLMKKSSPTSKLVTPKPITLKL